MRSMPRSKVQATVSWLHKRSSRPALTPLAVRQAEQAALAAPEIGRSSNPHDLSRAGKFQSQNLRLAATAVRPCCGHGDNGRGRGGHTRLPPVRLDCGCAHGRAIRRPLGQRACSSLAANQPKHVESATSQAHQHQMQQICKLQNQQCSVKKTQRLQFLRPLESGLPASGRRISATASTLRYNDCNLRFRTALPDRALRRRMHRN